MGAKLKLAKNQPDTSATFHIIIYFYCIKLPGRVYTPYFTLSDKKNHGSL